MCAFSGRSKAPKGPGDITSSGCTQPCNCQSADYPAAIVVNKAESGRFRSSSACARTPRVERTSLLRIRQARRPARAQHPALQAIPHSHPLPVRAAIIRLASAIARARGAGTNLDLSHAAPPAAGALPPAAASGTVLPGHVGRAGKSADDRPSAYGTGIGIILALRLAMIHSEPAMTRKTISTPKARARILFV